MFASDKPRPRPRTSSPRLALGIESPTGRMQGERLGVGGVEQLGVGVGGR